jgi:GT2 family glycosyltransferase
MNSGQGSAVVDVVIVTYRSAQTISGAVETLASRVGIHVTVVDNASDDETRDVLAGLAVETIALDENGGFAHGCNVGAAAGSAPYVLFLNPDARLDPGGVESLVRELEDATTAAAIAPRIVDSSGSLDYSLRRFPRLSSTFAQALFLHRLFPAASWVDEVIRDPAEYRHAHPVEWVSGACLLVRRSVLERIGGLDETFFHYGEDVDLCARIWQAGWEVKYVPTVVALHDGGASAPRAGLLPILAASRIRYSAKHESRLRTFLTRVGVALGAATHSIVTREGWTARRGHLRALGVALRPLPDQPGRLVRAY